MDILHSILVLLHLIGFAALFGGAFVQLKSTERRVNPAMLHGAITLLASGLLLVGSLEMGDGDVNHMKIGIKLVVLIAIFALVILNRKKTVVAPGQFWAILALTFTNAAIAVMW